MQEEFGRELQAHVVEVAHPAVAVLEPGLHDAEVRRQRSARPLQVRHLQLDLVHVLKREELERRALELALRERRAHLATKLAVERIDVGNAHHVAHRRNGVKRDFRVRLPRCREFSLHARGIGRHRRLSTLLLSVPHRVQRIHVGCGVGNGCAACARHRQSHHQISHACLLGF